MEIARLFMLLFFNFKEGRGRLFHLGNRFLGIKFYYHYYFDNILHGITSSALRLLFFFKFVTLGRKSALPLFFLQFLRPINMARQLKAHDRNFKWLLPYLSICMHASIKYIQYGFFDTLKLLSFNG